MKKLLKQAAIGLLAMLLLAACTGLLLLKLVQRKITAHMRPPHLQTTPETASDLMYRTLDGEVQHLSSTKGQVVFLDLWGT